MFLMFIIGNAEAARLVLLTSLPNKVSLVNIHKKLEKTFRRYVDSKHYQLKIIHFADQGDIFRELNDKENEAVFWVSHGAYLDLSSPSGSIGADQMILDYQYNNVAPIFSRVHQNLKYLSIISCHSEEVIAAYAKKIQFEKPLKTYLFDKKIKAVKGLKMALTDFHQTDFSHFNLGPKITSEKVLKIKLTRKTTKFNAPSARVFHHGLLLTVLPELPAQQVGSYELSIPIYDDFLFSNLKIEINSGENFLEENMNMGDFHLSHDQLPLRWKLFSKPNGEPFGVQSRIFLYQGPQLEASIL
jgi:hypothetical protein